MSAGKISMWFNHNAGQGNLHLVYLNSAGSLVEYRQTPDNQWTDQQVINNPGGISFQSVKLVQGVSSSVMLIALDTNGGLWFSTSDDNGGWDGDFAWIPNQPVTFISFDAAFVFNVGIVVAATGYTPGNSNTTYTLTAADGVFWAESGVNWSPWAWSNQPPLPTPFYTGVNRNNGTPVAFDFSWPPSFSPLVVGDNGNVDEGENAAIIAGISSGIPLVLYNDPTNSNWQWSQMPTAPTEFSWGSGLRLKSELLNAPPCPVQISDISFCEGEGPYSPILLLVGLGNLYVIAPTDDVAGWSYYAAGALPNPGFTFIQAKMAVGFPQFYNEGNVGNLQVIAINTGNQLAYRIYQNTAESSPLQGNWNWGGALQTLNPSRKIVDFDICMGITALQVAYLAEDGSVFLNYQNQLDEWGVYGFD
jgi:hypothetical protein